MKSFMEFLIEKTEKITNKLSAAYGHVVDSSPSDGKIASGGYKKVHISMDGIQITLENPLGTTRSGIDPDGKKWSTTMKADYGYFKKSIGYDKDHVDLFIKPGYKGGNETIHIVNQYEGSKFDEHKCVMGASDSKEAMAIYNSNYDTGWTGGKSVIEMDLTEFKSWVVSTAPKRGPA